MTTYDSLGRATSSTSYGMGSLILTESTTSYTVGQGLTSFSVDRDTAFERTIAQDAYGHQSIAYTDALGRERYVQVYTGMGNPYGVVRTTQYNRDEAGNLLSTVTFDASSKALAVRSSLYDGLGRVTGFNDSDSGSCANTPMPASCSNSADTAWSVSYDVDGNVLSQTDPRNVTTYTSYDALDRPLCRGTAASQVNPCGSSAYAAFFYDSYNNTSNSGVSFPAGCTAPSGVSAPVGQEIAEIFSNTAGNGWRCGGYDARGQSTASTLSITADSQTTTQTVLQSYNDAGEPTTLTYPNGEVVASSYDSNGYFRGTSNANGAIVSAVQYSNVGQLTGMTLGGTIYQGTATTPVQINIGYDGIQRPISTSVSVGNTTFFSQEQTYDNVGNVLQLSTTLPSRNGGSLTDNQSFCYDALSRLVWAGNTGTPTGGDHCGSTPGGSTTPGYTQSFQYDAIDRITTGSAGTVAYNDPSHVHAVTGVSTVPNQYASYDAMGNMICRNTDTTGSQSCASGAQTGATMSYDNDGRLASWTAPGGATGSEQYLYDNEGNRVLQRSSTINGDSTMVSDTITFDGYTDTTISNGMTTTTKYYQAAGQEVAEGIGTAWYYLVPDLLGSATLALKSDGSVQAAQLYAPYGSSRYSDGTMPTAYNFTGQRFDSQTGLFYYNARYYDPVSGRFTSADVLQNNTVGMDPYAYVAENPETLRDPTGHWGWDDFVQTVEQAATQVEQGVEQFVDTEPLPIVIPAVIVAPVVLPALAIIGIGIGLGLLAGAIYTALTPENLASGTLPPLGFDPPSQNNTGNSSPPAAAGGGQLPPQGPPPTATPPPSDGDGQPQGQPGLDQLDKNQIFKSKELLSDTYRNLLKDQPDVFKLRDRIEVKNGMVKSGLSHFTDMVDLTDTVGYYGLNAGTSAPDGLEWRYKWNGRFNAWHVGLDPVGGPNSMSLEGYNDALSQITSLYEFLGAI